MQLYNLDIVCLVYLSLGADTVEITIDLSAGQQETGYVKSVVEAWPHVRQEVCCLRTFHNSLYYSYANSTCTQHIIRKRMKLMERAAMMKLSRF